MRKKRFQENVICIAQFFFSASRACTLICLIVAQMLSNANLQIRDVENCKQLEITIAKAMIKGNASHAKIMKEGLVSHLNLNIEEALVYGGNDVDLLREWVCICLWAKLDNVFATLFERLFKMFRGGGRGRVLNTKLYTLKNWMHNLNDSL